MIRRSDWQAVEEEWTAEELFRYRRGEMSPEEEERMRARLEADPDLALALDAPFPEDEPLPQEEVSRRWEAFDSSRRQVDERGGKILQFWRASTALAAALALVFGALLWRSAARRDPRVLADAYVLAADGQRGGSSRPVTVEATRAPVVLTVPLFDTFQRHRMELVDDANRVLWRSGVLARPVDRAYRIELSLDRGRYRVVLYGVDGTREQRVNTYSLRVR